MNSDTDRSIQYPRRPNESPEDYASGTVGRRKLGSGRTCVVWPAAALALALYGAVAVAEAEFPVASLHPTGLLVCLAD